MALAEQSVAQFEEQSIGWMYSLALVPACLEVAGRLLAAPDRVLETVELWGRTEALRKELDTPLHPIERSDYDEAVATARGQLGEETFARTWARGRNTPIEQAIAAVFRMKAK